MNFFLLDTLADHGRGDLCFTDKLPNGIGSSTYRLAEGDSLREAFSGDVPEIQWQLGDDFPGLKLASFIGNTGRFFAVHQDAANVIQQHRIGEAEVVPFTLYNHRGRVHSRDYVFVNPLGSVDCLNTAASVIRRANSGRVLSISKVVLDADKPLDQRDLFRIREKPRGYVLSERLVTALAANQFTNFTINPLEQLRGGIE